MFLGRAGYELISKLPSTALNYICCETFVETRREKLFRKMGSTVLFTEHSAQQAHPPSQDSCRHVNRV